MSTREYQKQWYIKNRETILGRMSLYRQIHRDRIIAWQREYRDKNRELVNEQHRTSYRKHIAKRKVYALENKEKFRIIRITKQIALRDEIFTIYGMACANCDYSTIGALCIDHINGKGNSHRRSLKRKGGFAFYQWLKKNNFPAGYQTLCFNCNKLKRDHELGFLRY